jgi:hypothetical protein
VVVHGNANHAGLVDWFDKIWDQAQDFDAALMNELCGARGAGRR